MSGATTLEKSSGPNAHLNVKRTLGLLIRGLKGSRCILNVSRCEVGWRMRFVIIIAGRLDFDAKMRYVAITSNVLITSTRELIVTTFDLICVSGTNDLIFQVPKVSRNVQI